MNFLAENVVVLLCLLIRRNIALNNFDKLFKKLLAVSANIGDTPSLHMLLNKLPIFLVHPETLKEQLMLFICPSACFELHVLLLLFISHIIFLLTISTFKPHKFITKHDSMNYEYFVTILNSLDNINVLNGQVTDGFQLEGDNPSMLERLLARLWYIYLNRRYASVHRQFKYRCFGINFCK